MKVDIHIVINESLRYLKAFLNKDRAKQAQKENIHITSWNETELKIEKLKVKKTRQEDAGTTNCDGNICLHLCQEKAYSPALHLSRRQSAALIYNVGQTDAEPASRLLTKISQVKIYFKKNKLLNQ